MQDFLLVGLMYFPVALTLDIGSLSSGVRGVLGGINVG